MISSNTRATRSRYASPAQVHEPPKSSGNDASRSFMQRWLEPSLQTKASFEEAGLMRYGVLETMAPLGTLPKSKKPGNEGSQNPVRKIILRPSNAQAASSAPDVQEEPDSTMPASRPRNTSPPPLAISAAPASAPPPPRRRLPGFKDADNDEYDPKEGPRRRQSRRISLPNKPRQPPAEQGSPVAMRAQPTTPKQERRREPEDAEFAERVIEAAVEEALKHYRYPTAWALRTLYDEKSGDADFVAMIEDVFKQTADADTMEEFSRLIEVKKREGKKDSQGCYYFVPPSTSSRFTPHKPKPGPYAKLIHRSEAEEEVRAAKKPKTSHTRETPRKKMSAHSAKANGSVRTPSRKRNRRDSGSSDSSLSSTMSVSLESSVESPSPTLRGAAAGTGAGAGAPPGAAAVPTAPQSHDAPKSRPITNTRRKSLASNKQAMSNASESNSPPPTRRANPSTSTSDATMPGRTIHDLFVASFDKQLSSNSSKPAGQDARVIRVHMSDDDVNEDDAFWKRRRDAQKVSNGFASQESSIRCADEERDTATPVRKTRKTRQSLGPPLSTRATRSASKRSSNDDVDVPSSPIAISTHGDGSSIVGSRAVTPTTLRPPKKPRIGLRIKSSPVKKKGGTAAGVPRSIGESQPSLQNNGTPREQGSDNDEDCSACGNTGDVVCCDGCPRSFHFECVDMIQSDHLPDEWYCNECIVRRFPSRVPMHSGAFASALNNLEKSIPRAFSLPKKLQNRFEGVRAGADGDYEEITTTKGSKKRPGYDELPDLFKLREDGEAVLCHACQKPATEIRAIILCSACPLHWHMDCLDPPMAVPPPLRTWRCPAHVDDVLSEAPFLAPAHRFRKLKNGQPITPVLSRGTKNNGHIEVDWADEPEEPRNSGWPDPDSFGRTYKLPAKAVVLDFIEQLRHQGAGYGPRRSESRWIPYPSPPANDIGIPFLGSSYDRKVEEIQASLNLIGLKQKPSDDVDKLTSALLAAADDNVVALMAKGNADNIAYGRLAEDDKVSLRAMLAQMEAMSTRIRRALGEDTGMSAASINDSNAVEAITPAPAASDIDMFPNKIDQTLIVAEPTPPSTVDHGEGGMELD